MRPTLIITLPLDAAASHAPLLTGTQGSLLVSLTSALAGLFLRHKTSGRTYYLLTIGVRHHIFSDGLEGKAGGCTCRIVNQHLQASVVP